MACARRDASRAAALPAIRVGYLGPPTHLGGVPCAGQVDPARLAGKDQGGRRGAVVGARDAAACESPGILHGAAGSVTECACRTLRSLLVSLLAL